MNDMKAAEKAKGLDEELRETFDENEIDDSHLDLSSLGSDAESLNMDAVKVDIRPDMLSDIFSGEKEAESLSDEPSEAHFDPEALFNSTVSLMESGEMSTDSGITLLNKAADGGCMDAVIYLGKLYADASRMHYNPTFAFSCFKRAHELDLAEGSYYLGLCYLNGVGCDKDPETAVDTFMAGAERDNNDCICALGICRENGIGCDIDYEMAVMLYTKAAENGSAVAMNNLGGCYFYGHGVLQDREYATELYMRASELGNMNAACRLGICCETGIGCKRDDSAAFEHYKKAAESGNAIALYRLALCYDNGIGTEQNFAKAFSCYNRSASAGCASAMYESGMMSKSGRGTKKSASAAYKMFDQAAELGLSDAQCEVGNCYLEGIGTVRNVETAYLYYLRAFETDNCNASAAFRLGLCNLKGLGTVKDEKVALEWFCRGAELGSGDAAYMKGECYYYGVGIEKSHEIAVEAFSEAIEYQNSEVTAAAAYIALAECMEKGLGIKKNFERALSLYKSASDMGSARATYEIGRLYMIGAGQKGDARSARTYILRSARNAYVPAMLAIGVFADEGRGVPQNASDAEKWYAKAVSATVRTSPELYVFPERFHELSEKENNLKVEAQYRLGMLLTRREPSARAYMRAFENIAFAASLGHGNAQLEISKIYLHGGDLKSYYELAYLPGDPEDCDAELVAESDNISTEVLGNAMNKLGDAYFDGKTLLKKNEVAAARCYKIAAELGNVDASYSYGWCLRHGTGVNENDAEAIKWLKLAADRGNVNAAYSYGLCCEEGSGTGIKNRREARSYYRKAASAGHIEAARRYMALSSEK